VAVVGAGGGSGCGGGGAPYRRACDAAPAATARDVMVSSIVWEVDDGREGGGCDYEGGKVK